MRSYQRAKELIRSAVRISDRDSILWNHYAKVEAALKNYPRARALFNRACDVNPTDWYVLTDKRLSGVRGSSTSDCFASYVGHLSNGSVYMVRC